MRRFVSLLLLVAACGGSHLAGDKYGERNRTAYDTQASKGTANLRVDTEDAKNTLDAQRNIAPGGAPSTASHGGGGTGASAPMSSGGGRGDILQPLKLDSVR